MTEHWVRGHWLTGGVKFLQTHYPPETNERLLGALPKGLRALVLDIQPVQLYPRAHHVDLLNAIASVHRDEASAYDSLSAYGELVANDAAKGALRPLMGILTLRLLARKLPDLWRNDHPDDGVLDVDIAEVDDACLGLKLSGLNDYAHVGVVTLGWIKGLVSALGARNVVLKQTGWSLGQGAPDQLTFEVRWS
ncbi:MAG TPA: hypothetical protein VHM25_12070 [Polyangiaceae bacterium]|jgi:hypothetical protein|nr:hypothetical protein [Polyangiaceae bacterium]